MERKADGQVGKSGKTAIPFESRNLEPAGRKSLDQVRLEIEKILASHIESKAKENGLIASKRRIHRS